MEAFGFIGALLIGFIFLGGLFLTAWIFLSALLVLLQYILGRF